MAAMTLLPPALLERSVAPSGGVAPSMELTTPDRSGSIALAATNTSSAETSTSSTVTPRLLPMARFPTNDTSINSDASSRHHPHAHSTTPASHTLWEAASAAVAFDFTPPYTINNPYVRPYVATLVYPVEPFDTFHGVARRDRPGPVSSAHWLQQDPTESETSSVDIEEEKQGQPTYEIDMSELYMSRLLSPSPQMYEDSGLLLASQSR
jgi:hypothetical protein